MSDSDDSLPCGITDSPRNVSSLSAQHAGSRLESRSQNSAPADLSNAEAFQLFSFKLDAALAENKKLILREFDNRSSNNQTRESTPVFSVDHHRERYNFFVEVESDLDKITNFIEFSELSNAKDCISRLKIKIKEQKKVLRIADKYGWDVAREFKDDPITENSEESSRLRQAEARAKRKRSDKNNNFRGYNKAFQQQRYSPYGPNFKQGADFNSGTFQPRPYRVQPDQCLYCNGFGHWSVNCPLKKRNQSMAKPTATQTSPSTENTKL
jgi:hypothetical protein